MSTAETEELKGLLTPEKAFKKARMLTLMNNYEAQLIEAKRKDELARQTKQLELEELKKKKEDFLQYQMQNKLDKKTVQSSLASHYDQMANYQKALREKERQEESQRHEKLMEENKRAVEAEKERRRVKLENLKQEQLDFLRQKEEERMKIGNNGQEDFFKRSNSSNIFKNKLKVLEDPNVIQSKPVYLEDQPDEEKRKLDRLKYRSFLEAQMQEKSIEKQRKKDIFSSQAELNLRKMEELKEYQKQEAQRRKEEQMRYREFLNIQNAEKNNEPQINSVLNSTNQSLVQHTPIMKQNNEKLSPSADFHNPLLNPMPFNVQNPYLYKEFKKGLIPSNPKQNAYFANIANAELLNKNFC